MDDHLVLGSGYNIALTGGGNDYITSGDDGSRIEAGAGNDTVLTGAGRDVIDVGSGSDAVVAGAGNDTISLVIDGTDTVSAGAGIDRLSADASGFNYYGTGRIWWEGTDAQGNAVGSVDVSSSFEAIQTYVQTATTNQLNMFGDSGAWWVYTARAASLTFSGVENLDVTASGAVDASDLMFVRGTGHYDAKGGVDTIYADLTAMTTAVRFVANSGETYSYLGSTFAGFERFLVGTGSGDDYIDSTAVAMDDHLVLGSGNDTAHTGGGNDWVDGGAGDDTIDGGAGNDTLTGGSGSDTFVYALSGNGIDRITDIGRGDVIRIVGAVLGGSVVAGDGTAVGLGQVQVSTVGTQTTLHIGTDAAAGADVVIRLDGVFAPSAVHATGDTITIDVPNNAPTGPIIGNLSDGVEDTPYSVGATQLLAGFSDLDGDALRVINLSSSAGAIVASGAGQWLLTPPANFAGIVDLSYKVVDDHGGGVQASRSITIAAVNDAPEASGPLPPAAATQGLAFAYTLPADVFTDAEGDVLSYSVTLLDGSALPAWLHFNEINRSFSGTPGQIDVGILQIKVTASDGQATGSTVLQLDVANVNDAPVGASTHAWAVGQEDTAYALSAADLLKGFSDPDGDEMVV